MEPNPYSPAMAKLTNRQLVRVLGADAPQYLPIALEAAELELQSRQLSPSELAYCEEENATIDAVRALHAIEPLELHWRIVALFFPGALYVLWAGNLHREGYVQKVRDLGNWSLMGFVGVVVFLLSLNLVFPWREP
jgi:hypothetical protein